MEVEVLVKEEPRVECEELEENEYHHLDPLVVRAETDLWCNCPSVGRFHFFKWSFKRKNFYFSCLH